MHQAKDSLRMLRMASTTSTEDTGLLPYLASLFEKDAGIALQWIATGSGRALDLGRHCDVDVLLVHSPEAERQFMAEGCGSVRKDVMYNDFVLAGPASDPANVRGKSILDALRAIAASSAPFVSRGDDSGTHQRELALWKDCAIAPQPSASWLIVANRGMADTLEIAADRNAYVLTDRGTFVSDDGAGLALLVEGGENLRNQYGVIAVNESACGDVRGDLAMGFIDWLTSEKGQSAIADFRLQGSQLFIPNAKAR